MSLGACLESKDRLLVKITNCQWAPVLAGRSTICTRIDISNDSLKLIFSYPAEVGTRCQLQVEGPSSAPILLATSVQWSQPIEAGRSHLISFRILPDQSDIAAWNQLIG